MQPCVDVMSTIVFDPLTVLIICFLSPSYPAILRDVVAGLPENSTIFDLGANYGIFSIYTAELMGQKKHKVMSL